MEVEKVVAFKSDEQPHGSDTSGQSSDSREEIITLGTPNYIQGWRLHLIVSALCSGMFLSNLEVSIVSTSLVAITDDLRGFSQSSWIVTAYLLTFSGFMIVWAKLSDIYGRKLLLNVALSMFVVFSGGCGAAQTTTQVIICRAFQGIGGSGIYGLTSVIFMELVPASKYAAYTSLMSMVLALGILLGPLLGGAITTHSTWRWVFLLNVPTGFTVIVLLLITIPNGFPDHGQVADPSRKLTNESYIKSTIDRIDVIGTVLLLAASLFLMTALQLAGREYAWLSAPVITLLVLSAIQWPAFILWERFVSREGSKREPVFPWSFCQNRVWMGMLLTSFLAGVPFVVSIIDLPLRFQAVNGRTPFDAGVGLLPFAFSASLGSAIAAMIASKLKVMPIYILFGGAVLQTVGIVLLSLLDTSQNVWSAQYAFEVIAALGAGGNTGTLILTTPFVINGKDRAVAMGAVVQFRMMGGAIGLAIVTSYMNSWLNTGLAPILSPEQLAALLQSADSIGTLPPAVQTAVRTVFAQGFNMQFKIAIAFTLAQFPATALMWTKEGLYIA